MLQFSAEQFRQKLAGLECPERKFNETELSMLKTLGTDMVLAMREVFGGSLDRKTLWERISNGITIAAAKSGGKGDRFLSGLLDYVKAEANAVVGSDILKRVTATIVSLSPELQRQFIRTCVEYRMILCLEAREDVQEQKSLLAQTGAKDVTVLDDGTVIAKGVAK